MNSLIKSITRFNFILLPRNFIQVVALLLILLFRPVYAQFENKIQEINGIEVVLFVDNVNEVMPDNILNKLNEIPVPELGDGIIYYLAGTGQYQNVFVNELYNKELHKNVYLVTAHYTKKIQDITFKGASASEQIEFQKNLTLQAGKAFKEYLIPDDVKKIEKNIQEKGYLNAQVKGFQVKKISNNIVTLTYTIEKGAPCRIDQIFIENSNANILNFINLPIETGSLCDIPSINDKLLQIKNNYWKQGYLTAEAKIKAIDYASSKERAKLILTIEKGHKTIIQIRDENQKFLDTDFLNSKQNALTYSDLLLSSDSDLNAALVKYYQNMGYPYAAVSGPQKIQDKNQNTIIRFSVKKGDFVKIGDIFFVGDLPENKNDVIEELQLKKGFFSRDIPFFQENLLTYRDKLKNIFLRNGYADAQVSIPDFNFSADGKSANLIFNTSLGDKYILSQITIQNFPEKFKLKQKNLDERLKIGDAVNFDNKQSYVSELTAQLKNHGYLYAQIKLEQEVKEGDIDTKQVNLNIKVDLGPVVKIGRIFAQGDLFNKEKTIISISGLETGDIFVQNQLDQARNRILRHDLFSSIVVEPLNPSAVERKESVLDVVIRVRGRSGYLLTLSPGWGTFRGYRFGVDYSLNQITNDGLRLISSASVSQEKQQSSFASNETKQLLGQQLNLGFTEPLFKLGALYTPLDLSAIAGYQVAAETLTNREYQTLKLISEWKPIFFNHNWSLTTSFIHEKSISTSSESAVVQVIDSPSLIIREFLNSVSFDTRNNMAWPTQGGLFSFGFGMARFGFGSDEQFNRYLPRGDIYFPIYNKLSGAIFAGGVFVSETIDRNGETVTPPASRRATLTDEALIRGFPETYTSAAPGPLLWIHYNPNSGTNCRTQLASVGGTNMLYLKSEGRYRFNDVLGMIAFFDTGTSYLTTGEVDQVNKQIQTQIHSTSPVSGQCTVDDARLVAPAPNFQNEDALEQYWRQAYVSTGLGLRIILGNVASISLDYGYPLKDPQQGCMSPTDAINSNNVPTCISRIQNSSYSLGFRDFQFKGAVHLGIDAKF